MGHRGLVLAQIVEHLAGREMQQQPVLVVERGVAQRPQHMRQPRTVGLGAFSRFRHGEVCRDLPRVEGQHVVECRDGFLEAALANQHVAEQLVNKIIFRVEHRRGAQLRFSGGKVSLGHQGSRQVNTGRRRVRCEGSGAAPELRRLLVVAAKLEKIGKTNQGLDQARRQRHRPAIGGDGIQIEPLAAQRQREVAISRRIIPQRRRETQALGGLRGPAAVEQGAPQPMMDGGIARVEPGRPGERGNRAGKPARGGECDATLALPLGRDGAPRRYRTSVRGAGRKIGGNPAKFLGRPTQTADLGQRA